MVWHRSYQGRQPGWPKRAGRDWAMASLMVASSVVVEKPVVENLVVENLVVEEPVVEEPVVERPVVEKLVIEKLAGEALSEVRGWKVEAVDGLSHLPGYRHRSLTRQC